MTGRQIQLVVTHRDHQVTYHQVPEGQTWKVDPQMRCLVVGRGVPRQMIPLDGVLHFDVEETRR
jgi:hypothetical protein